MMSPRLRKLALGLAALVAAVLTLVIGFVAFLHTGPGERWVSGKIEQASAGAVELDGYHLRWPFRMRADYLRVLDSQGTWLEIAQPELRWQPQRLLRRELHIDRLAASEVVVRRQPVSEPKAEDAGGGPAIPRGTLLLEELSAHVVLAEPVLGDKVELDLGGTFQMRGGGGDVDLHLRSAGGALARVNGTAGTDYLDLRWYLRLPQIARWQRLAGIPMAGELVGAGVVAGRLPAPAVSGKVELSDGWLDDFHWDRLIVAGRGVPDGHLLRLSVTAEAEAPRWGETKPPVPRASLALTGEVAPDMGRVLLGHGRLEGGGVALAATGVVEGWGHNATLRLSGEVPALDQFGLKGGARIRAMVAGDLVARRVEGRVRLRTTGFSTGDATLDAMAGPQPMADALVRLQGDRLIVEEALVTGANGQVQVQGSVGDRLSLWGRLALPELAVLTPSVRGSATGSVRLRGPLEAPAAFGVADLHDVQAGAVKAEGAIGFSLPALTQPQGSLAAEARINGRPVTARSSFSAGDAVRFDGLQVASGNAQVTGNLAVAGGGMRGSLSGSVADLAPWGVPLSGRIEADAVLDPASGQSIRLNARSPGLVGQGISIGAFTAQGEVTNVNRNPTGALSVAARGAVRGGIAFDQVNARLSGNQRQMGFDINGSGAAARLEGAGTARLDAGLVRIDRLRLASASRILALAQATSVRWGKGEMALAPSVFTMGAGRLDLEGRMAGERISAQARLEAVPLEVLELVSPGIDAVGRISGSVRAQGTMADPNVHAELSGQGVGFAAMARAGVGTLTTRLVADWRGGRARVEMSARDGERLQLTADASAPLPGEGALDGRFRLIGDAARISEVLPLAGHVFAGRVDVNGTLGGTLSQPLVSGRADLAQGRYENLESGTLVSPLSATADFQGDRIRVTAQGGDGGRGSVQAEGSGGLDGTYGATLVFKRFTALRRDDVEAEVNGTLNLVGESSQGRIDGRLTVPRAEVDIGRLKGGGPVTLDVVEINKPGQKAVPPRTGAPSPEEAPVTLALAVDLGIEHAFVRGRGLDSEWQGQVAVGGTVSQPVLTGKLAAARGEYDFLGQSFRLSPDSAVAFQGGDAADPSLDVLAQAKAEDITAQIQVSGTAKAPNLQITSEPPLPQDEVLSRLLFGREVGKLSAFQQLQLAQMAASGLTGGGGGFDPVGRVRNFLGLDVLGVGSAQTAAKPGASPSNAPTVSAGKYIGRDTFVRVEQGTAGLGEVTVEQDLGGGFSVETSLGEQSGGGVGLNWRKDY